MYATDPNYGFTLKWVMQNSRTNRTIASESRGRISEKPALAKSRRHRTTRTRHKEEGGESDNPFSEPGDDDRTVIVPCREAAAPCRWSPLPRHRIRAGPGAEWNAGDQRLRHWRPRPSPLLQLLAQLRGVRQPSDPGELHARAAREPADFERRAREAGIAMELVHPRALRTMRQH